MIYGVNFDNNSAFTICSHLLDDSQQVTRQSVLPSDGLKLNLAKISSNTHTQVRRRTLVLFIGTAEGLLVMPSRKSSRFTGTLGLARGPTGTRVLLISYDGPTLRAVVASRPR